MMATLAVVQLILCLGCLACLIYCLLHPVNTVRDTRRRLLEVEATCEDLYERLATLHGRKAQASRREHIAEDSASAKQLPHESPMDWKRRVRKLMNQGQLKLTHGA